MLKILSKLFDTNQKNINRYQTLVEKINALESDFAALSNPDLKAKTQTFKDQSKNGASLDDLLPQAFAAVREAGKRSLNLRHFDVQLIAGMAFHEGKVAEQKTGEGKTLSATLPLYLNALTERGAHLVTVNDYLAQRDAGWMSPIFHALGLSVGVIYSGKGDLPGAVYDPDYRGPDRGDSRLERLRPVPRQAAYACDITYGTNNEFGFDYLRDNMVQRLEDMVQRDHYFAIVDEVDSILIDEARTPLIISAPDTEPTQKYFEFAKMVDQLQKEMDYSTDEKLRTVSLTDYGLRRLEKRLGVDNLYEKDYESIHHMEQALKAKTLFTRDKDYVVKDGQVIIVDEHTGRLMFGRRYSEGLHQAIEAKEGVTIQRESRTLATISLQNYFRMYEKLAGMTGTASTEAEEFNTIYGMDVVVVPTNQDVQRRDASDMVFKTKRAKFGAIVKEVREKFDAGQPVLLGTKSIEQNEVMARYLKRMKIPHSLLNAKNHEQEALILADAGKPGAVTVATNIAGRGVDIVLGGSLPEKPVEPIASAAASGASVSKKALAAYQQALKDWQVRHDQVLKAGGLHVLGTERHDSRRIDNQLRGRSGRQGDPGSSRFFVSLEDDLMRIFGGEQVSKLMDMLKIPEDQPIESGMVSKSIQSAQAKVEGFHLDQRKRVVEYDDVMNKQREIIYKRRKAVINAGTSDPTSTELKDKILTVLHDEVQNLVVARSSESPTDEDYHALLTEFLSIIPFDKASQEKILVEIKKAAVPETIITTLTTVIERTYADRETLLGPTNMRQLERFAMLSSIDRLWMDHLDAMDDLREGIWLRGGKDTVLSEYKKEAFELFSKLLDTISTEVAHTIFRIQVGTVAQPTMPDGIAEHSQTQKLAPSGPSAKESAPVSSEGVGALAAAMAQSANRHGSTDGRTPIAIKPDKNTPKVGRNDPCPCGAINPATNKPYKWKKCGMINAPHHKG